MQRTLSFATYALTTCIGVAAFLYPFWLPALPQMGPQQQAHAGDSALMLTLLVGICLAVLLLEVQSQGVSTKAIALLGVLVAINATLRFAETAIPGPGGFSPIFPLIVLVGYVFGGRMGFLMGALTMLASAIITGGVGPWLPYQMFTAGWVGLTAPLCRPVVRWLGGPGTRAEIVVLAIFGGYWGLLFGAIMNIWFWPFATGADGDVLAAGHGTLGYDPTLPVVLRRHLLVVGHRADGWDGAADPAGRRARAAGAAPLPAAVCVCLCAGGAGDGDAGTGEGREAALDTQWLRRNTQHATHAHRSASVTRPCHPLAWAIWVTGVLVALTTTRNPFYLGVDPAMVGLVVLGVAAGAGRGDGRPAQPQPLALWPDGGGALGALQCLDGARGRACALHAAASHAAGRRARSPWRRWSIGALNGLVLAGLFAAFAVVNRVVPVRAALGLVPRAYYPVAVVLSIAVTFVPSTLHAVQQIREAQAVRGRSMRGLGSWLPLIIPLLEGSLERSMQLAEAMMARGFASATAQPNQNPQALVLFGLIGVVGGWLLRLVWQQIAGRQLLLVAGVARPGSGVMAGGPPAPAHGLPARRVAEGRRPGRLPARWRRLMVYLAPLPGIDRASLFYYPYPALSWPTWDAGDRRGDVGVGDAGSGGNLA